jgi:hypothetical protein
MALGWAFWRRSLIAGLVVINAGAVLKVIWSFYFGGGTAWSIVPAVSLGALICNGVLVYAFRDGAWPPRADVRSTARPAPAAVSARVLEQAGERRISRRLYGSTFGRAAVTRERVA